MEAVLAFDLGTGGNKVNLYYANGELAHSSFYSYDTKYPGSGLHEQRPDDWFNACVEGTKEVLQKTGIDAKQIRAIAVSGHSLGCVPIGKNGELLLEYVPIWSDSRGTKQANTFFNSVDEELWYTTTGNGFPAGLYTAFKIKWYEENRPEFFAKTDKFIGTKDYVNYKLTGELVTDYSYASGSGVYNLKKWAYEDSFIKALGLRPNIFPQIIPSTGVVGNLTSQAAKLLGLTTDVKVIAGGVDNSCMALGAGNTCPGRLYASLGSSSWVAVSDTHPLLDTKAKPYVFTHVLPEMYTSALGTFSSGTTFQWIKNNFCKDLMLEAEKTGKNVYEMMIAEAMQSNIGANGLTMNPSLAGGSSLDVNPEIRGFLSNIDLKHSRKDIIRAGMEGISFSLWTIITALRSFSKVSDTIRLVGGGSINPFWRQMYADAMNIRVEKTNIGQEAAALGAAALAAVGAGLWDDFSTIDDIHKTEAIHEVNSADAEKYLELMEKIQAESIQYFQALDKIVD